MLLFHFTPYFLAYQYIFFHFFLDSTHNFPRVVLKKQKSRRNFSGGWILSGQGPGRTSLKRIRIFRAVN